MSVVAKFLDYPDFTPFMTDMRLQVGAVPWVNINRKWQPHPVIKQPVSQPDLEVFVRETQAINDERDLSVKGRELDFAFSAELGGVVHRFRGHESRNYQGMAIDVRILRANCRTVTELGFHPKLIDSLLLRKNGLVLVGGPTGSGKSTTLAALIYEFGLRNPGSHIVTLEDPVEYIISLPQCLVSQKQVPVHVDTFERGIFQAKREKPDLIVIGELRTKEAIRAAIEAAGSGHLIFATTFADRMPRVLDSIEDAFLPTEHESLHNRLSYLLRGIICQTLVPRLTDDPQSLTLPELVYETLCNDEVWVGSALRKGSWGRLDFRSMDVGGESSSWETRIDQLIANKRISEQLAEFLKKT